MARILVVEDDRLLLKLLSLVLTRAGHEVVGVSDAREAEQAVGSFLPQLIVMDIRLPGKDGFTFTRELRARPATAKLPIVAITSYSLEWDERTAREAGCTDYLAKPVSGPVLCGLVNRWLS
jgi:CheY-like chemotaxis protein